MKKIKFVVLRQNRLTKSSSTITLTAEHMHAIFTCLCSIRFVPLIDKYVACVAKMRVGHMVLNTRLNATDLINFLHGCFFEH